LEQYRRWTSSAQGALVFSTLFLVLAALNYSTWWLAAILLLAGAVNGRRAWTRWRIEKRTP
jgi:hypothetical protein